MNPFKKISRILLRLGNLSYQARGMLRSLPWPQKIQFIALCLRFAKTIVKTDRFLVVDAHLAKSIDILYPKVGNESLAIPFRKMEQEMDRYGNDGASLELVRELFGNNEYLKMFKKGLQADITFDVGSNRGFFALVASKLLKSKKIVCIEPQKELQTIRHLLASANDIPLKNITEYHKFCSAQISKDTISINQILIENKIEKIDFLKMDVEGAESDIFSDHLEWLDRCKNIAMEIHYSMAKVGFIPELLRSKGFQVLLTDVRGNIISEGMIPSLPHGTAYLYASSNNQLAY